MSDYSDNFTNSFQSPPGHLVRLFVKLIEYMFLPTVKFRMITRSLETDWLYGFLFNNKWGWGKRILRIHPKLEDTYKYTTIDDRKKYLRDYVSKYLIDNKLDISEKIASHVKRWQQVEFKYFSVLAKIIQMAWPKKQERITALISINPICPRFLNNWSFSFNYQAKPLNGLEIIMHESCHFLYFEKWSQVFPGTHKTLYEYPHLEWHLSEILAPIILDDSRIQPLLRKKPDFYQKHKKLIINNQKLPLFFQDLYKHHLAEQTSFADFLKSARKEAMNIEQQLINL